MGYDADWVRQELLLRGVLPVIPPNPVRKEPVPLDRELYRLRNRVERLVNKLKQFRAVATRYDKTAESFLAFVQSGRLAPLAPVRPHGLAPPSLRAF